jgi:hypothetical protein
MWVDNDVPNWFPTLKNFYLSPFSKWPPLYRMKFCWNLTMLNLWSIVVAILKMVTVRNFWCQESIRDIIFYLHMKCRWNRTMLNLCYIVVAILKMATGRNLSMSGINSGHSKISTGRHFQNGHHNTAQIQHCSISMKFHT